MFCAPRVNASNTLPIAKELNQIDLQGDLF
jgi:hypothetical protein